MPSPTPLVMTTEPAPLQPQPRIVLLVEDEPDIRYLLRFWLELDPRCATVHEADSPDGAVAIARRVRPDVVLLDFRLTGGTALDCLPALREALPTARIIVYTANLQTALEAGVDVFADRVVEKVDVVVEDVVKLALDT